MEIHLSSNQRHERMHNKSIRVSRSKLKINISIRTIRALALISVLFLSFSHFRTESHQSRVMRPVTDAPGRSPDYSLNCTPLSTITITNPKK